MKIVVLMICNCGFKHKEDACPMCQTPAKVKKKKRHYLRPVSKGKRSMADFFRDYVQFRFPGYSPGMDVRCDNCGLPIASLNFGNMSHLSTRGARPDKAFDFDNMAIHCCSLDFMYQKDISCHTLWERNREEEFNRLSGTRRDWKRSAGGLWVPTEH